MTDLPQPVELEVLLPVHDEAATIEATVREIYEVYKYCKMPGIFVRHVLALVKIWYQTRV